MSFFESNREILLRHYPGLFEELTAAGDDVLSPEDVKIETAPSGDPSLCVKGIYVHSQRDPLREGRRLAEAVTSGNTPVIILGFGLGYAACAAAGLGRPLIIVEKYKNLLLKAMELRDFTDFLTKTRIIFIAGGSGDGIMNALGIASELVSADKTDEKPAPYVIRNKALFDLDKEWYGAIEGKIRTWSMRDDVNTATLKRFGRRWVRNLSRNLTAIRDYPGISALKGIAADLHTGIPVFLAAAGPSLDKTAPLLRDIYRRCIVVAVDTNLRFFADNGVQPDFVLTVDPQFWNSRHLDRCVCERTVLIAESAVYPPVLHLPFRKIFLCGSLFPFGAFIEKRTCPKGSLGAGGSVATSAWDFARSLASDADPGGQDIWIAGLDLAFPDLKTHFRGARFEERSLSQTGRFSPVETWVVRALRDGIPFKARSAAGGQVFTDRRLSLYAAWFENQFAQHGKVRNFALFQEGLAIMGLQAAGVEKFLALPDRRDEIDRRLEAVYSKIDADFFDPEEKLKRSQRYEDAVSALIRGLENIRKTAEEGAAITQQALNRTLNPSQKNKILGNLDEITQRIANSEVKEVAGFLFPTVKAESTESDPFRAYLMTSHRLFSSLAEAAGINLCYMIP